MKARTFFTTLALACASAAISGAYAMDAPEPRATPKPKATPKPEPAPQPQVAPQEPSTFDKTKDKAEKGNVPAQVQLGILYLNGDGCSRDAEKAYKQFKRAAAKGNVRGMLFEGICLYRGLGVKADAESGLDRIADAAIAKDADAMFVLSQFFANGTVVDRDDFIAQSWREQAIRTKKADDQSLSLDSDVSRAMNISSSAFASQSSSSSSSGSVFSLPSSSSSSSSSNVSGHLSTDLSSYYGGGSSSAAAPQQEDRSSLDPLIDRMRALRCKEATSELYQKRLLTLLPMIRNGAEVDLTLPETKGNTALHYSCAIGSLSITKWLLEHGANPNAVTDKGATPLQCVGDDNAAAIRALLIKYGAQQ